MRSHMPVRSLNSSVVKWPDLHTVEQALRDWVSQQVKKRGDILRAGYFGSYARGDWGVNSDLDLILILDHSELPFWRRSLEWDVLGLPVPVDLLVYTLEEWHELVNQSGRFPRTVEKEAIWVYQR
jgi:predicted nucleotidyltransferase